MQTSSELAYYSAPGPMTDLSSSPPGALYGLPAEPDELTAVVRGCVVEPSFLIEIFKENPPQGRDGERQLRRAADMVARILELDRSPIATTRPPERRLIGTCRSFATLSAALLRHREIPVRVRAGFAGYFRPGTWVDHWIVEYHRVGRWVRVDPELDDGWLAKRAPGVTSESLAQTMFVTGAEAWKGCRSGKLDPEQFNMGGDNWGIGEIRGSVLYDLAALNQDEMLPWDTWGDMQAAYRSETDAAYDELLDRLSDVVISGDFEAIRAIYEQEPVLKVPAP